VASVTATPNVPQAGSTPSPATPSTTPRATAIVALDVPNADSALMIVSALGDLCRFYKVGSELFTGAGPSVVRSLTEHGCQVFLDLKFHDIPNTTRGAARSAARIGARLITVHATGGRAMMEAAMEGARQGAAQAGHGGECEVFAVTVLTSLDGERISEAWGRTGVHVQDEVLRLAEIARRAGVTGIVCGGAEAPAVRVEYGNTLKLLIPGVRLPGSAANDQLRVVTPGEAVAAGASYVIVGRTVTAAAVARDAMRRVLSELD
jgi:orotidine-5'-phosphate decarboxylase